MKILPFFAHFLETQKLPTAPSGCHQPPVMHTLAYPSDSDTDTNPFKFRPEVLQHLGSALKDANHGCQPEAPGKMVTLRYPSDSDTQDTCKLF